MRPLQTTSDGWQTHDVDDFEFLACTPPPRKNALWRQIKIDAQAWKPIVFWVAGIGNIALAVVLDFWALGVLGGLVLAIYFRMLFNVVRSYRNSSLKTGRVTAFEPLPVMPSHAKATVLLEGGESVDVVFPISLIGEAVKQSLPVEVLFLADRKAKVCLTVAARAVQQDAQPAED